MESDWWFASGDKRGGPLTTGQLQALLDEGALAQEALVWRPGRLAWKPIGELPEFTARPRAASDGTLEPVFQGRREPTLDIATPPAQASAADAPLPDWARPTPEDPGPPGAPAFAAQRDVLDLPLAGPWRRLLAQFFDVWTLCVPVGFLMGLVTARFWPAFSAWLWAPGSGAGAGLLFVPLSLVAQAIVFGLFGTTLGKVLFGVRVTLLGGGRPTFMQYMRRMVHLYWSGLGLAIPFVTLVTMWRQHARLKSGRPASYDAARFQVHAAPMGTGRRLAAALGVLVMVVGFGVLQHSESEANSRYFAGFDWHNPISDKRIGIPPGWVFTQQLNVQGDPIFTFSSHSAGVVSVFAMEDVGEDVTLEQYHRAWVTAVRPQMALDVRAAPIQVQGRFALQMNGVVTNNASRRVHAVLIKNGSQVWRIVSIGSNGSDPDTSMSAGLRAALVQTLPERPERPQPSPRAEERGASI